MPLLSESLSLLNTLSWKHCIPESLIIFDTIEGRVIFANEYAALLLGYESNELMKMRITDIDLHTFDLLSWQGQSSSLKRNGRIVTKSLYLTKNGTTIPVEIASNYCGNGSECIICIIHDISPYTEQTEKISISLQEKEHLLKEIHHRVKNNLQTISSLLSLGRKKIKDESVANVLQESQNRIYAIATVHEILYKSDRAGRVDMSIYLRFLTNSLIESFGALASEVTIERTIEPLFFVMDTAMPCGLIVNELVTNALQHAFNESQNDKKITITLHQNSTGSIILKVIDNGKGFNNDDQNNTASVGLKLVNILTKQLDGTIHVNTKNGTIFELIFNAPDMIEGDKK
ncbi:MAG TPA: histidine kinase dimerization/phosphoacceptor domain -containing protein [Sulfuricurvum sp.]|nr:histidine kinase dimerization/phosphoacceptor domain -containing protein [Sulfuricurvum sp.]